MSTPAEYLSDPDLADNETEFDYADPEVCELVIPTGPDGDRRIRWKRGDEKSTTKARAAFEKLKAKGYSFLALEGEHVLVMHKTKPGESTELAKPLSAEEKSIVAEIAPGAAPEEVTEAPVEARPIDRFEKASRRTLAQPRRVGG